MLVDGVFQTCRRLKKTQERLISTTARVNWARLRQQIRFSWVGEPALTRLASGLEQWKEGVVVCLAGQRRQYKSFEAALGFPQSVPHLELVLVG